MNKSPAQQYLEKQILNASPAERVVLCYDGAIKFLMAARRAIEENKIQDRYNNNKRAGDIIAYLMDTLNMEEGGQIASNLQRIYMYMLRRLMDVDMKNSTEAIDDVVEQLRTLRASWEKVAKGDVSTGKSPAAPQAQVDEEEAAKPVRISATA
ncbi:MAG: flagellar export chaperone FliS [Proteobacteria bacterium]|nr:flagellar export chaperone FliS [Pseudomonadota bacterium]